MTAGIEAREQRTDLEAHFYGLALEKVLRELRAKSALPEDITKLGDQSWATVVESARFVYGKVIEQTNRAAKA